MKGKCSVGGVRVSVISVRVSIIGVRVSVIGVVSVVIVECYYYTHHYYYYCCCCYHYRDRIPALTEVYLRCSLRSTEYLHCADRDPPLGE